MPSERWDDLAVAQKRAVVIVGAAKLGLSAAALTDIHRRPTAEIRGGKRLWTVVAFVNFVGPISYFFFGRRR